MPSRLTASHLVFFLLENMVNMFFIKERSVYNDRPEGHAICRETITFRPYLISYFCKFCCTFPCQNIVLLTLSIANKYLLDCN